MASDCGKKLTKDMDNVDEQMAKIHEHSNIILPELDE